MGAPSASIEAAASIAGTLKVSVAHAKASIHASDMQGANAGDRQHSHV